MLFAKLFRSALTIFRTLTKSNSTDSQLRSSCNCLVCLAHSWSVSCSDVSNHFS